MSFTGDLEHLPIVDIIQLLHATRKSGTLTVRSRKGESQLVFKDGFIVSANHLNNSVRIGQVLTKMDAISSEQLQQTLLEQKEAGDNRKPLIATLLENGTINKEVAYKGLENLIEMTVVDILTWDGGTFDLSVDSVQVSDEYRYFPEKLHQEISLDTQNVLMDALRIYDEQKRDGQLEEQTFDEEPTETAPLSGKQSPPDMKTTLAASDSPAAESEVSTQISAADLGLDNLDELDKVVPDVFQAIKDTEVQNEQLAKIQLLLPDLPEKEALRFTEFLRRFGQEPPPVAVPSSMENQSQALVFFSQDKILTYALTSLCKNSGLHGFTTDDINDLEPIVQQYLEKEIEPILVIDRFPGAIHDLIHKIKSAFPALTIIQLGTASDFSVALPMFQYGIRSILPRPETAQIDNDFVDEIIQFLSTFYAYIFYCFCQKNSQNLNKVNAFITGMRNLTGAPDVSQALLLQVGEYFPRSITFVIGKGEVVAERGVGILHEGDMRKPTSLQFRFPLETSELMTQVIKTEQFFFGMCENDGLHDELFKLIGAPKDDRILLLPMKSNGRVITLTYGDFGEEEAAPIQVDILAILAHQAGLIVENSFFQKQLEKKQKSS
ncbi:MAG: hypothetical protein C0616_10625 [Desulfuromonas sp.]|nr:MAG: hypothetical protein C0616_10625 [Desulfuromonas sp.]